VATILMSGSADVLALGLEPDLSSLRALLLDPLLSSPEERAPSLLRVLTPLSDTLSSSILHLFFADSLSSSRSPALEGFSSFPEPSLLAEGAGVGKEEALGKVGNGSSLSVFTSAFTS